MCHKKPKLDRFAIARMVGADLRVSPGLGLPATTAADAQVCPHTDLQIALVDGSPGAAGAQRTRRKRGGRKRNVFQLLSAFPTRPLRPCGARPTVILHIILITVLSALLSPPLLAQIPAPQQEDSIIKVAPP